MLQAGKSTIYQTSNVVLRGTNLVQAVNPMNFEAEINQGEKQRQRPVHTIFLVERFIKTPFSRRFSTHRIPER